jgi:hypothetical protein
LSTKSHSARGTKNGLYPSKAALANHWEVH